MLAVRCPDSLVQCSTGKKLREDVAVMRDGSLDRALTDSWDEYVETLLPVGLSTLFFTEYSLSTEL